MPLRRAGPIIQFAIKERWPFRDIAELVKWCLIDQIMKAIQSASLIAVLVFGGITAHAQIGISPTATVILDHRLGTKSNVWKSSSGMSPTSGGIAFGFFTGPFYSKELFGSSLFNSDVLFVNDILTHNNFYGSSRGEALHNMGFRDFRSFSAYGLVQASGDCSFSSNPDISFSTFLSGTRLYEIAFGLGEWNSETNDRRDATFGEENWGIDSLSGHYLDTTQNYEFPSSGDLKIFRFEDLRTQIPFCLPP